MLADLPAWLDASLTRGEHSVFAPSGAFTWVNCAGSLKMVHSIPADQRQECDIEASEEGTAAHDFGARLITGTTLAVGAVAENGHVLTDEMLEAVATYYEEINRIRCECQVQGFIQHIEKRVECERVHALCFGTPDYWCYNPETQTLYVRDYKHGHKPVEAFECWQLILYTAGILRELGTFPGMRFDLGIVQPRSYHSDGVVRTWRPTLAELGNLWDRAKRSATMALSDDPVCKPGAWCYKCPGRLHCKANQLATGAIMDYMESATPTFMTPAQTAAELVMLRRVKKLLEYRIDAAETEVINYHQRGELMPAVCVERGKGREVWKCPQKQAIAIGTIYGKELAKSPQAITPKQARKLGIPEEAIRNLTHTPETGLTITEAEHSNAGLTFARNPIS